MSSLSIRFNVTNTKSRRNSKGLSSGCGSGMLLGTILLLVISTLFQAPLVHAGNASAESACEASFSAFRKSSPSDGNPVMLTQNFILYQIVEGKKECARHVATTSQNQNYRNYYIGLANYFNFGNEDAYFSAYSALQQFNYVDDCQKLKWESQYAMDECAITLLMQAFILIEMNDSTRLALEISDRVGKLYSTLGLAISILELSAKQDSKHENLKLKRTFRELDEQAYNDRTKSIGLILYLNLLKSLVEGGTDDVIFFGHSFGSTKLDLGDKEDYENFIKQMGRNELYPSCSGSCDVEKLVRIDQSQYCEARNFVVRLQPKTTGVPMLRHDNLVEADCMKYLSMKESHQ